MKKRYLLPALFLSALSVQQGFSQCTPTNCLSSLPPYGGICDTNLLSGAVGQIYSDFESFHTTTACFDAGLISPANAGTGIKITVVDNFTFSGLPVGVTGSPNQSSYTAPANGCVSFQGTPTQAGNFLVTISFLADVTAYPFGGGGCTGFSLAQNNNAASYHLHLIIRPNPSFTIPSNIYCTTDPAATLTVTGTPGGTFSGPGVSGTTFNPSTAGVGTHTIWYVVSAQQGSAVGPATDSSSITVQVVAPSYSYYIDSDNDTYGDENASPLMTCFSTPPAGYVSGNTDCNDANASINPGALEIPANMIDENCDGIDGALDADNDGYNSTVDCNDNDSTINPGATEICDGIDNNCTLGIDEGFTIHTYYLDQDADGYGNATDSVMTCAATPPSGYAGTNTDCDDSNNAIHPGAAEVCDGLDNDCNLLTDDGLTINTYFLDGDADGYGLSASTVDTCLSVPPAGYAPFPGDCDDSNANINPGVSEICDGTDNNCNNTADEGFPFSTYYLDSDGDGYGTPTDSTSDCSLPSGYAGNNLDCDDGNPFINPAITDVPDNGVDENCDGNDATTSNVNSIANVLGLQAYPNPASQVINITGDQSGNYQVRIYDMQGRMLLDKQVQLEYQYMLDVSALQPGSYTMEMLRNGSALKGFMQLIIVR